MDPVAGGAIKQVQQSVFEQAEQQIEKSNQQVSDFENLRSKLEAQDAISSSGGVNQMQQTDPASQVQNTEGVGGVEKAGNIPEIKNMDQLESMVNDIRNGQDRLNQIISEATSGKTYSPQQMLAMQAEVGKITTELEMATKVVENFVSSVKTTLNIQF